PPYPAADRAGLRPLPRGSGARGGRVCRRRGGGFGAGRCHRRRCPRHRSRRCRQLPEEPPIMTIAELRVQIDALDRRLVELLDERGALAQAIGMLKQGSSLPIYEADREARVIAHAQAVAAELGGRLPAEDVRAIFERMIRMMRE